MSNPRLLALSILTSASFLSASAQSLQGKPSQPVSELTKQPSMHTPPATTFTINRPGEDFVTRTFVLSPEQQAEVQTAMDHQTCYYLRTYKFTPQTPGSSVLKPNGETVCQSSTKSHLEGAESYPADLHR